MDTAERKYYLIVISEMTYSDVFLHIIMIKIFFHPTHITPIDIPVTITDNIEIKKKFIIKLKISKSGNGTIITKKLMMVKKSR